MSGFCYTGFSSPDNVANGTRRPKSRPTEPEVQKETQHSGKSGGFSNVSEGFGRSFGHNSPYGFETGRYSHFSSRINQNAAVQSTGARGFGSRLFGEKSEQHVGLRELKNRNRISNGFGKVESDDIYDPFGTLETQSDRSSAGSRGRTRPRQLGSSRTSGSTDITIESVGTVTGALRFLHLPAATEKSPCDSTGFGHNSNEEVGVLGLTTNCFVEPGDPFSVHLLDRCFKCRESVTDWGKGYHPAECKDALQGFMTWNFETTKTKFYCEKKFSNYQTLSAGEMRKFYKILGKLTPGTEDKFEEEFGNILRTIEGFGNMGGRSLVVAYDLFWRKLSVTEAFEFKLHDLRIEQVRIPVDGDKNFRGYELSFSTGSPGGFGESVMEVAALRRKLKCNGVYGFPIFICIREDYHSVQWHNADPRWPDDIPRKLVSKVRLNTTVYQCHHENDGDYCKLIIDPLKELQPFVGTGIVSPGKIFLAFNYHANRFCQETRRIRRFIDKLRSLETFPKNLKSILCNFYDPKMEIARVYSDVTRDDLGKFNELLPSPYKLFPEQLESAVMAYQFEMNAILGPSGTGKTTIFCFLAIYNWFALRRKTLLLTTRRGAANEITLRIVRMSKFLLELPQFRHLNNGREYIWCKLEKDSFLEHKDPEIRDVCSFDHEHPEQITMLVAVLNFLTSAPVLRFKCDHIVMDEASSVSTLNFYTLLAVQNMEKRHLPQHLTIFGDQFQLSARFSKETFLGDKDEKDFGFDESALVQLLKCKLPCTQMKNTVRSPKVLCKIIQPFYDYTISTDLTALARPLALRFDPFGGLCDLHRIVLPKFVSIFINLPAKDANGNHFCAADGRRDSEPDRRLNLINRRNIHYALCIFDAILERNSDISNEDCLYLTPYRVQESEFHHRRTKPGATGAIRGQTIDRAVSTEAPFVLLDLVRTSSNGFMNGTPEEWPAYGTAQRLLVALSRATRAQIIIGSVENSRGTPSNPIEKLAAYHRDSRDSLVGYIDMPSSRFSRDHYKV